MQITEVRRVRVYPFTIYNVMTDQAQRSRRMGTIDGIKNVGGTPLQKGSVEIDEERLSKDHSGLTDIDFQP